MSIRDFIQVTLGSGSSDRWTVIIAVSEAIIALGTIVIATITSVSLIKDHQSRKRTLSIELALRLEERFDSDRMQAARKTAAMALIDRKRLSNKKVIDSISEFMDFFETVGNLVDRGDLDIEIVYSMFYEWIVNYTTEALEYIEECQTEDPEWWQSVMILRKKMLEMQGAGSVASAPGPSNNRIQEFLKSERKLGSRFTKGKRY